jgi:hypothetical protein
MLALGDGSWELGDGSWELGEGRWELGVGFGFVLAMVWRGRFDVGMPLLRAPVSLRIAAISVALALPILAPAVPSPVAEARELFNGRDLAGWIQHLADETVAPETVFSVTPEGNLRIAGEPRGYVRTAEVFTRYRLTVEWRWVGEGGNSGVLLHTQGPERVWPLCIEAQLRSERAGDIVCIGVGAGGSFHGGDGLVTDPERPFHVSGRMADSSENPVGEWNRYVIEAEGTDLRLFVNGVKQNEASALRLTSGSIGLQSEGAPIEFRRIALEPLP